MEYTLTTVAPIVLLPFFAFVINSFIVKKMTKLAVGISCAAIFGSFLYSLRIFRDFVFGTYSADFYIHKTFNWFNLNAAGQTFSVDMGIYIDNMTAVMLLMVTGTAFLIHVFSTYYMKDDARYGRFFVYLSLFTSAMLGLVVSDNLLSVFVFWEIMGFCSYSLIGFYYEKEGAGNASMKAFMTTRVGDVFLLFGILAIWSVVGNVNFVDIYAAIADGKFNGLTALGFPLIGFAALMLFMGTIGKSAQFPLQVWLPDAMWGPTPCSALIHAATMVAAGVYLSLRGFPLLDAAGLLPFVAYIGGITALGAATIALVQTDIKAVLAYSTISQLGYMVLGVGVGAYNPAFMHLITHAVFKACLFLAAGSVIHSLHCHHTHAHVQEMPRMGGLRKKLPFTFLAMLCCTLAIAGIPFFSGFVSKDRILGDAILAAMDNKVYVIPMLMGFAGAFLTAFYMFRMMFLTFFGEPRDKELFEHTYQEKLSWNRNIPLLILAVFTLGAWYSGSFTGQGLVKVPGVENKEWFKTLITKPDVASFRNYEKQAFGYEDTLASTRNFERSAYDPTYGLPKVESDKIHRAHKIGAVISIIIAFSGVFLAFLMYIRRSVNPAWWVSTLSVWYRALQNKYYMDDLYLKGLIGKLMIPFQNTLARFDMGFFDRYAVDGWSSVNRWFYVAAKWFDNLVVDTVAVDGTGASVRFFNVVLRTLQSGKLQFYIIMIIVVLSGYIWSLNL
jgi:NADH-quinone oxidoreductase subunit L